MSKQEIIPVSFAEYAATIGGETEMFGEVEQAGGEWVDGDSDEIVAVIGEVKIVKESEKEFFAVDAETNQIVGYATFSRTVSMAVQSDYAGRGIATELAYQLYKIHPFANTGGMTEGGRAVMKRVHARLLAAI